MVLVVLFWRGWFIASWSLKISVTGTVKEVDGKLQLTPTKITLAKED